MFDSVHGLSQKRINRSAPGKKTISDILKKFGESALYALRNNSLKDRACVIGLAKLSETIGPSSCALELKGKPLFSDKSLTWFARSRLK